MPTLRIDNYVINAPLYDIVKHLSTILTNGKLHEVRIKGNEIVVSCPIHKNGLEQNASCGIYIGDSDKVDYGTYHCFTCGASGSFIEFISECFNNTQAFAKQWLISNYGERLDLGFEISDAIVLSSKKEKLPERAKNSLTESILDTFQSYHPYMTQRKLTREIIEKFKIKYDTNSKSIIFPVWDINHKLVMLTKRNVIYKRFEIPSNVEKPVYLLDYIISNNIPSVIVCESQINALTCLSYHLPAIALFGTGSGSQYEILNSTNIKHYILCLDGDEAGQNGANRFVKNINKNVFVDIIKMPYGKDINDLSKEEFFDILNKNNINIEKLISYYK